METILDAQDLWEAVDPDEDGDVDPKKNKIAKAMIFQSLPEHILAQMAKTKESREIWRSLATRYIGADRVKQAKLQSIKREFDQLKSLID